MAFIAGARQVGKTTTSKSFTGAHHYFNWDNEDDRLDILSGPASIAGKVGATDAKTIIFDELHKYPHWRNFIKGF